MAPAQEGQVGIGETLHTHAQAVDRRIGQRRDKLGSHIIGIRLEGHLAARPPVDHRREGVEQSGPLGHRERRGCSPAQIDGRHRLSPHLVATQLQLAAHRLDIAPAPRRVGRRKEVAIDTATRTKRNMYIDTSHQGAKVQNFDSQTMFCNIVCTVAFSEYNF